jgi:hypothetical protein
MILSPTVPLEDALQARQRHARIQRGRNPEAGIARMGIASPAATPQRATLLRASLPCETAAWLFHNVDRRRTLNGQSRIWMSHSKKPRLDGDQAERCAGNLPFASRLMAVLSMTGH